MHSNTKALKSSTSDAVSLKISFFKVKYPEEPPISRLWEAATDLVNLNTWFSWQSSITPLDSLPLAVGKVSVLMSS